MNIEELRELSDRIRSENKDRPRVSWPRSFKQIVVKELSNGKKVLAVKFPDSTRVYVYQNPIDMRWGYERLSYLVVEQMGQQNGH